MYTGLTAKITINNSDKEVAYISNWSVDETRDIIEVTCLGKKTKEVAPSLYYWSASAEGTADFTTPDAQKALREAMVNGTKVDVKFYLDDDTYLTGKAYVNTFSTNISAEDKGGVSISLTGDGELAMTAPQANTPSV